MAVKVRLDFEDLGRGVALMRVTLTGVGTRAEVRFRPGQDGLRDTLLAPIRRWRDDMTCEVGGWPFPDPLIEAEGREALIDAVIAALPAPRPARRRGKARGAA